MPLVDGTKATRMIRKFEREYFELHQVRRRVPIIATSASLTEEQRFDYIEAGYAYSSFSILPGSSTKETNELSLLASMAG